MSATPETVIGETPSTIEEEVEVEASPPPSPVRITFVHHHEPDTPALREQMKKTRSATCVWTWTEKGI